MRGEGVEAHLALEMVPSIRCLKEEEETKTRKRREEGGEETNGRRGGEDVD